MNNLIYNSINRPWSVGDLIHSELMTWKELIYNPYKFICSEPVIETESIEYGACMFEVNSLKVRFRIAKITPTKVGQFVTLWKRVGNGPIQPYDVEDEVDLFIVSTRKEDNLGQFIFPKSVLYKHDIVSNNNQGGKRAIRVYPPWDNPTNKQAKKTQAWQLEYFLEVTQNKLDNYSRAKILYSKV